ncbi:IclR family transcriptional regulator [Acrocarpospora catenulata]|uniref:IclR family transcriptional regulator n=1 Tax=Acrocarpospora catenulata TaxID=2836182 RepID=UPI001BD916A2|nr:IclR family transcriptional regulator [Acrocarpospora catenulata]
MDKAERRIASVSKAFTALAYIASQDMPVAAKELSQFMRAPLPTTYHLLNTLVAEGALVKGDDRGYRLGPRIGALGDAYLEQGEPIDDLIAPMRELAATTGETAYLSTWRRGEIEVVATAEGSHSVRVAQVPRGTHAHAHARASGKLLLAYARPGLRDEYLAKHRLEPLTPHTITDPDEFALELDRIRTRGYSIDLEEFALDVTCVAAPIVTSGRTVGAFTVSCPSSRYQPTREHLVAAVINAARRASLAMSGGADTSANPAAADQPA